MGVRWQSAPDGATARRWRIQRVTQEKQGVVIYCNVMRCGRRFSLRRRVAEKKCQDNLSFGTSGEKRYVLDTKER
ncbi:hypothetical protein EVAR_86061_1 [Eumeta japonica]|uniref:Uncharacterized protein n=1 Tax=Eumeta variegata TaxID=151549 RepID=A0A4C1UJF5_EUMVA|nr:hypothetical protein EVAR_86061_1 [Eumeta japonica]